MQAMTSRHQQLLDALEGIAYTTDPQARLTAIGRRGWREFAADNGAPELADTAALIGRSLFDFIAGDPVRDAFRQVMERAAASGRQVLLPCRCDGPGIVRDTRLTVSALRRGRAFEGYLFHAIPLAEHARPPLALFDFAARRPEDQPLLGMCSLCERVSPGGGERPMDWLDAEAYYARGGTSWVRISHTICPDCFARWIADWTGKTPRP